MFKIMDMAIWPINKLINNTLQLDQESLDKLAPLAGKVLAIELTGINQTVYAYMQVDALRLSFSYSGEPHTTLIGTPLAFMRFLMQKSNNTINSDIKINGDPHFAQQLQMILTGLSIDWEEQLSKFIGDNAAHQMGRFGKGLQEWLKDTRAALRTDTKEYLQQETQQLPERHEINNFLNEVDKLRNDVERLAVRIKKLKD
jgi:ubiquinone biosynthesis protein UbiJ